MSRRSVTVASQDLRDRVRLIMLTLESLHESDPIKRVAGWHVSPVRNDGTVRVYWMPYGGKHSDLVSAITHFLNLAQPVLFFTFGPTVRRYDYWLEVREIDPICGEPLTLQQTELDF